VILFTFALRGSIGFGGAIGLPLLALVLPVKVLAPAWSLIGIASSAAIAGKDRKHVVMSAYLGLLPGCALGVLAGLFVFQALDAKLLARLLGVFVIGYGVFSLFKTKKAFPFVKPIASFLSGAVGTLFGAMASIFFAMYLGSMEKNPFRATLSAMLMTLSVARTIAYAAVGELTVDALVLTAAILPAMGLGLVVGDKVHTGLSERAYGRLVSAALLVCGAALLFKP